MTEQGPSKKLSTEEIAILYNTLRPYPSESQVTECLKELLDRRAADEPEPDENDADTCRLAFQAWANDLGLCLDEIFMSSDGVPEHPYEDNDTNQFWRAWLASWKAKRAAQPPSPVEETAWIIDYADVDRRPEHFAGFGAETAARRRYDQSKQQWTCRLFRCVDESGYGTALTKEV